MLHATKVLYVSQVVCLLDQFAKLVLSQLATAMSLSPGTFESILDTSGVQQSGSVAASVLETINYKPPHPSGPVADQSGNCEAHVDKGLLTLVFPDTQDGLQASLHDTSHSA